MALSTQAALRPFGAALVKAEPGNGRAWFRLGLSHQNLKEYENAISAFRKSESIGHNPLVMYHLACALALTGGADSAFVWLGRAVDAGYGQPCGSRENASDWRAIAPR